VEQYATLSKLDVSLHCGTRCSLRKATPQTVVTKDIGSISRTLGACRTRRRVDIHITPNSLYLWKTRMHLLTMLATVVIKSAATEKPATLVGISTEKVAGSLQHY
jgi:hypothetical protein